MTMNLYSAAGTESLVRLDAAKKLITCKYVSFKIIG